MNKSTIIVYLNDFKLVFYDEKVAEDYAKQKKTPFNAEILTELAKITKEDIFISCHNLEKNFKEFGIHFIFIEAAGGLINNDKNEYLFIYRHNKWDLPKGKLEKNEVPEKAAIRECQEECGLKEIKLNNFLLNTYHIYPFKNGWALKKTYWYTMLCNETNLVPQLEESITKVAWKSTSEIPPMFSNTYRNIIDVLNEANLLNN
ncbi:MAG TPA: NUDIX domain-containing protein [Bacteroidia bacterium]|nr:NUDIX domain-containing protein [Bacteroidia bacterium]